MKGVMLIGEQELPYASDFEINKVVSKLKRRVESLDPNWRTSRNRRLKSQCLEIETEICYLQREIMWRRRREAFHKEYVKSRRASR